MAWKTRFSSFFSESLAPDIQPPSGKRILSIELGYIVQGVYSSWQAALDLGACTSGPISVDQRSLDRPQGSSTSGIAAFACIILLGKLHTVSWTSWRGPLLQFLHDWPISQSVCLGGPRLSLILLWLVSQSVSSLFFPDLWLILWSSNQFVLLEYVMVGSFLRRGYWGDTRSHTNC